MFVKLIIMALVASLVSIAAAVVMTPKIVHRNSALENVGYALAAQRVCADKGGTWERDGAMITCYKEVK